MGLSPPTMDWTQALGSDSTVQSLNHQRIPRMLFLVQIYKISERISRKNTIIEVKNSADESTIDTEVDTIKLDTAEEKMNALIR